MLNSAAAVAFPNVPPPMIEMPATRFASSGSRAQRERDVGERADRDDPEIRRLRGGLDDEARGVGAGDRPGRSGDLDPVEAFVPVDVHGVLRRARERTGRARVHGHVDAGQVAGDERVPGGVLERRVPGDRRDRHQVGVARRGEDGHDVVVAGIAVEEDLLSGHGPILPGPRRRLRPGLLIASPGSRTGSEPLRMANIQSQKKRNRQNEKRRVRNKGVRSELKTRVKVAVAGRHRRRRGCGRAVKAAQKRIDKAAAKGVIHKNAAARRTSRLMKRAAKSGA